MFSVLVKKILKLCILIFGVQNSNAAFHLPIPPDVGVSIVKASTAILPQVDSVGHFVLKTNEMLINKIIDSNLEQNLKKEYILKVIEFTRNGDNMGNQILLNYYNLINSIL